MTQTPPNLTASELVVLNGDRFARATTFGEKVELPAKEQKVSADQLGEAALIAAILANEEAGTIRLAIREKKKLFGLRRVQTLVAEPGGKSAAWPEGTLEAGVRPTADPSTEKIRFENEVAGLVYNLLGVDSSHPATSTVGLVHQGLATRGHLEIGTSKRMKIITVHEYKVPEATRELLRKEPVEPVERLFAQAREIRPDVWGLLEDQVRKGLKRRVEIEQHDDHHFD